QHSVPRHTRRLREMAPVLSVRLSAPDGKKRRRGELVHSRGGNTLTYKPSSLSNLQGRAWGPADYAKSDNLSLTSRHFAAKYVPISRPRITASCVRARMALSLHSRCREQIF